MPTVSVREVTRRQKDWRGFCCFGVPLGTSIRENQPRLLQLLLLVPRRPVAHAWWTPWHPEKAALLLERRWRVEVRALRENGRPLLWPVALELPDRCQGAP